MRTETLHVTDVLLEKSRLRIFLWWHQNYSVILFDLKSVIVEPFIYLDFDWQANQIF